MYILAQAGDVGITELASKLTPLAAIIVIVIYLLAVHLPRKESAESSERKERIAASAAKDVIHAATLEEQRKDFREELKVNRTHNNEQHKEIVIKVDNLSTQIGEL